MCIGVWALSHTASKVSVLTNDFTGSLDIDTGGQWQLLRQCFPPPTPPPLELTLQLQSGSLCLYSLWIQDCSGGAVPWELPGRLLTPPRPAAESAVTVCDAFVSAVAQLSSHFCSPPLPVEQYSDVHALTVPRVSTSARSLTLIPITTDAAATVFHSPLSPNVLGISSFMHSVEQRHQPVLSWVLLDVANISITVNGTRSTVPTLTYDATRDRVTVSTTKPLCLHHQLRVLLPTSDVHLTASHPLTHTVVFDAPCVLVYPRHPVLATAAAAAPLDPVWCLGSHTGALFLAPQIHNLHIPWLRICVHGAAVVAHGGLCVSNSAALTDIQVRWHQRLFPLHAILPSPHTSHNI
uniref:5'-nucleotidase surE n=1 Tax=Lygus hesperus TaxID=30085 RepID=A0A0A9YZ94_LYGHE